MSNKLRCKLVVQQQWCQMLRKDKIRLGWNSSNCHQCHPSPHRKTDGRKKKALHALFPLFPLPVKAEVCSCTEDYYTLLYWPTPSEEIVRTIVNPTSLLTEVTYTLCRNTTPWKQTLRRITMKWEKDDTGESEAEKPLWKSKRTQKNITCAAALQLWLE